MLKIGKLKLESNLILAPMAGISDLSFRMLNRGFGAELAFVEMLNVRSLGYNSKKTQAMLSTCSKDKPLGVQILGCEEKYILRGLDILKQYKFDLLDFNAACPMRKIIRRGEGASLLKEPKKLNKLLKLVVKNSPVPVTVKIRTGWDEGSINAREVALYAQDAGIKGLFIHGRSREQEYSGDVNYKAIKNVKDALKIPVVASGNIFNAALAKRMLDETGCDGLLIARGALGNPWVITEIKDFLKKGIVKLSPSLNDKEKTMIKHLELCASAVIFRKFFIWYTKGMPNVRVLREKACRIKTKAEMLKLIHELCVSNCK